MNERDIYFIVSIYLLRLGDQTKVLQFINNISLKTYKLITKLKKKTEITSRIDTYGRTRDKQMKI